MDKLRDAERFGDLLDHTDSSKYNKPITGVRHRKSTWFVPTTTGVAMKFRILRALWPQRIRPRSPQCHRRLSFEPLEDRWVPAGCTIAANTCFGVVGDYGVNNQ